VNLEALKESGLADLEKICCKFCDEKFVIPANLDSHVQRKHQSASVDQPFECLFCSKLIRGKSNLQSHLEKLHKNEGYQCKFRICSKWFKIESELEDHIKKVHFAEGKNPVECKVCKKWYACKISLSNHMRKYHPEKVILKNPNNPKTLLARKRAELKAKELPSLMPCNFCDDVFESKTSLYDHTKKMHKNEAVKCKKCRFYFKTKNEMEKHFESTHKNKCQFCTQTFSSANVLSSHLKNKHSDKKCKFRHCSFYTDLKEELEAHKKEKHSKNESCKCVYCGRNFVDKQHRGVHIRRLHSHIAIQCDKLNCMHFVKNKADLEEHKKEAHHKVEKHKKTVACLFCQKEIWDNACYLDHVKRNHSEEALRCKYKKCFTFFKSENDRKKHYEDKHVGKYNCSICGYSSQRRDYMESHFQQHHFPKDVKCPHCPKHFGGRALLRVHFNYKHKGQKKCPHCGLLSIGSNLTRHLVTANCRVCSQPFPCRKLLADHKLNCKNVYKCLDCGRKFKIESNLINHVNSKHKSGQKWKGYKCKTCDNFFLDRKSLRGHQSSAHPEMVQKCDLCEETFLSRQSLNIHKIRVHDIGGVECKECNKLFLNQSELSAHLKWNHDKNNPNLQFVDCAECGRVLKKSSFAEHYLNKH